jgi:hypothetical protein
VLGIVGNVEFEDVETLRREHPAWKLLRAGNASLILSFLGRVFVEGNARVVLAVELTARLDDYLFALNERLGEGTFPKSAKAYLDDWAGPGAGWLRKYYPPGSDEQHFDATPAVEKAVAWIASLRSRPFVGTESRLNTVFELLRQMAVGAETDRDVRLEDLKRRREQLDAEIARVESGDVRVLDDTALRDRYQQFSETARGLLADFREVEASGSWTASCASGSPSGMAPRGSWWNASWATAAPSPTPTRAEVSTRSTTSCSRGGGRRSSPNCWRRCGGLTRSAIPTRGCATSTTTGSPRASARRPPCACCPSSCAGSWTTRCGWRTGGSWTS